VLRNFDADPDADLGTQSDVAPALGTQSDAAPAPTPFPYVMQNYDAAPAPGRCGLVPVPKHCIKLRGIGSGIY
jgi:hypothetical protein